MYINQQDGQNYVIRLYFPLDALHVSDSISPSSGATYFYKLYIHLVYADTIRLAGYSHTTARRIVPAYTYGTGISVWYRYIPNAMYSL